MTYIEIPKITAKDAYLYFEWTEEQMPEVRDTALLLRPWEWYKWAGREIYGKVVAIEPSGMLVDFQREDGHLFSVVPHQIELYAIDQKDLPPHREYQAKAA